MHRSISLDFFKTNLDHLLEKIVKSGIPLEIDYKGKKIVIVAEEQKDKLSFLQPHPDCLTGDPEDIVHMDWSDEWNHGLP